MDEPAALTRLEPGRIEPRRETLRQRLEDGYGRIDQALADGADVAAWESFWIELLHEYESICDEYQNAA